MLLAAILWNALLVAVLAMLAALAGRTSFLRKRPALMHWIWFGVLIKLLIPPLVPLPCLPTATAEVRLERTPRAAAMVANKSEVDRPVMGAAAEPLEAPAPSETSWQPDWWWALLATSLAGTLVLLAGFVRTCVRADRLLRMARPAPERLASLAAELTHRLGVRPVPRIAVVDAAITPMLWMRGRQSAIVFPRDLAEQLDDEQLNCVLAHELAHLLRHDRAFNLVALAVVALFWWHPAAWWARREMQGRQEECCDAWAIARLSQPRRHYASTLLYAIDFSQGSPALGTLASPGFGNPSQIARRFEMIANSSVRPHCSRVAVALLVLVVASLACFPVRADNAAKVDPGEHPALPLALDNPDAVHRMHESIRNLKQLCIALHDWAEAHQVASGSSSSNPTSSSSSSAVTPFRFPPAVIYGKDGHGKYPHSWRIELLPYLGARNLYDRYQFDEPWDSKANKVVLANMPEIFRDPADAAGSVNSAYFVLVGRLVDANVDGPDLQTFFSSRVGVAFRQVVDGSQNTLAIVEARRNIPWTKPEDIPYDPTGKLPSLGGFFHGGFCATFGDSSTWFLDEPIKDAALRAMISPASGDKVDYQFHPQRIPYGRGAK
jgi:beta-lactamase regulating signal transducer with metallopeptidase domain